MRSDETVFVSIALTVGLLLLLGLAELAARVAVPVIDSAFRVLEEITNGA